jgi:hypothetical protein
MKFLIATYSHKLERSKVQCHPPPRKVSGSRRMPAVVPMFDASE